MPARIRIIKRSGAKNVDGLADKPVTKSDLQTEREMADTVKGWVADWHERKCQLQTAADALIKSMGIHRDATTQPLVRVH